MEVVFPLWGVCAQSAQEAVYLARESRSVLVHRVRVEMGLERLATIAPFGAVALQPEAPAKPTSVLHDQLKTTTHCMGTCSSESMVIPDVGLPPACR